MATRPAPAPKPVQPRDEETRDEETRDEETRDEEPLFEQFIPPPSNNTEVTLPSKNVEKDLPEVYSLPMGLSEQIKKQIKELPEQERRELILDIVHEHRKIINLGSFTGTDTSPQTARPRLIQNDISPESATAAPNDSKPRKQVRKAAQATTGRKKSARPSPEQLPEPPPGLSWPQEKFEDSRWKGKRSGVIKFIRETEWTELLSGNHIVTMQMINDVDYDAYKALVNYRRDGRKLPDDIKILSDHSIGRNVRQGLIHAQLISKPNP